MARLPIVDPENSTGKARDLLDAVQKKLSRVPNSMRVMANSPAVLEAYLSFSAALAAGSLNAKLREQIALEVGEQNSCQYCVSAHTAIGRMTGLSEAEIEAAREAKSSAPKPAAALAFARHNARRSGCQQARFQFMDWRSPTLRRRYNYILASDVIYEARNFAPLTTILRRYLARGGTAVFSEPGRVNAVPFLALVRQHGFTCETESWPLEWEGTHQIALHTIRHQGIVTAGVSPAIDTTT